MVAAEESRIKEREEATKAQEEEDRKKGKKIRKHEDQEHGKIDKGGVRAP